MRRDTQTLARVRAPRGRGCAVRCMCREREDGGPTICVSSPELMFRRVRIVVAAKAPEQASDPTPGRFQLMKCTFAGFASVLASTMHGQL
jgi:hypothetical protein